MSLVRIGFVVASVGLALGTPSAARADSTSSKAGAADAIRQFDEGSRLLREGKANEALPLLASSMAALPSPNTMLLIAHAERELGDRPLALEAYDRTVELASQRVKVGESRFQPTLDDAEHWASELRAGLGRLVIHVRHADAKATLRVDGAMVETQRDELASTILLRRWHEPGWVNVEVADEAGHRAATKTEIQRGLDAELTLDLVPTETSRLPPAASWVTAGVGVAGIVTFGIFEGMARDKQSTLEACAPHCNPNDPALVSARDAGKRDQAVAGVSIGIGVASLAAAGILWAVWPKHGSKAETQATLPLSRNVRLDFQGTGLSIPY